VQYEMEVKTFITMVLNPHGMVLSMNIPLTFYDIGEINGKCSKRKWNN